MSAPAPLDITVGAGLPANTFTSSRFAAKAAPTQSDTPGRYGLLSCRATLAFPVHRSLRTPVLSQHSHFLCIGRYGLLSSHDTRTSLCIGRYGLLSSHDTRTSLCIGRYGLLSSHDTRTSLCIVGADRLCPALYRVHPRFFPAF
jgi:hypothetical protein